MKVEPVSIPNDAGGITRMYRATQRVPAASGAPVEFIACAVERMDAIRELVGQLAELNAQSCEFGCRFEADTTKRCNTCRPVVSTTATV